MRAVRIAWGRRRRGGRLGSLGHDYDLGHRTYVERLDPAGAQWLRTKPFSAPPSYELARCLRSFAHLVERLGLGERAQVLDVGCGPGWLSEFLARCGYWVTGVDISEDMVAIARERLGAIAGPAGEGLQPVAEFHAMPVREMPWGERFDAAVLYDAMHHFDDELETLRVIRRTLVPGGRIYIHEGVRPEAGSPGERELIGEMRRFETLEAPFDPTYLESVLSEAGFVHIRRFVEVDELLDVGRPVRALREVWSRLRRPETNTFLATNAVPEDAGPGAAFRARIEAESPLEPAGDGAGLVLDVTVTNTGRAFWPTSGSYPFERGAVTIGPYLSGLRGERLELPRALLPRSVSPGQSLTVRVRVPAERVADHDHLSLDLVREGIAWFSELGSEPLVVPLGRGVH